MATSFLRRVESATDALLRSPAARYGGLLVGLGALAFLAVSLVDAGESALAWFRSVSLVQLGVALGGFALYQTASVLTLRPIFGGPTLRIWGAGQLVKYLPVPGSAVIGIVGSTVQGGGTTRHGLAITIRHSLLQVGGASMVASAAVAVLADRHLGIPVVVTAALGIAAGAALAWFSVKSLGAAVAATLVVVTAASWAVLGFALWYGVALGEGGALVVAASFAAAWVVGQLALPVPAGLGVREAALLLLLGPVLGEVGALAFALGTRVVHVASDAGVAGLMLARGGWRGLRAARSGDGVGDGADPDRAGDPADAERG